MSIIKNIYNIQTLIELHIDLLINLNKIIKNDWQCYIEISKDLHI